MAGPPRALTSASDAISQLRLAGDPEWIGRGADRQDRGHDRNQSQTFAARVRSLCRIDAQVVCAALLLSARDTIRRTKGGRGLGWDRGKLRLPRSSAPNP